MPAETRTRHIHLDPAGGLAGDMFVAALCQTFPEHADAALQAASTLAGVGCRLLDHRDAVLTGVRFSVGELPGPAHDHADQHHHHDHHDHAHEHHAPHGHTHWRDIRVLLLDSSLPPGVVERAVAIFGHLARAEAEVHGVADDDVTFHEVGNADSIADIVAAAWLIEAVSPADWSVGALPLGSGRVLTAHGWLAVPAPATALLLRGFEMIDDGVAGERVTPTGAAILRHLAPRSRTGMQGVLEGSGIGFGTRVLPGLSNVLRVLVFATGDTVSFSASPHRELCVVSFEVDDQSPEDLAAGLDRLRAQDGVHDVMQAAVFGKKGRMAAHVQVLARADALEAVVANCFRETTTIGLRTQMVQGRALSREMREVDVEGVRVRLKTVERPGGRTAKAESDDTLGVTGQAARARMRRLAEAALETSGR